MREKIDKPYRKNCEGYFFKDGKVLAKDRGKYIEFPGGGVEEDVEEALIREVLEETGYNVGNLKKIGVLHFDWSDSWAVTEKQKKRKEKYRGEEMHFFTGEVLEFNEEGEWGKDVWLPVKDVIKMIKEKAGDENMKEYEEMQLKVLERRASLLE